MVKNSARRTRRTHSPAFKARVALAVLRDNKTMVELCKEFELHASQVIEWKWQLLEGAADLFGGGGQATAPVDLAPLHAKIGQLALENDFLERALSNPALVSARSKKSFSRANWPILACRGARSTGGKTRLPAPRTSAAPSSSWRFQSKIWLECTSYSLHGSAIVLSSRKTARATCALNAGLWVRHVRRADFLTIENLFSPGPSRPSLTPEVSTYRAVQNCGATSVE